MTRASALVAACLLFVAACGDEESSPSPDPSTTSTLTPAPAVDVDWDGRTISGPIDGPFEVGFCEGDAPLVCFTEAGEQVGFVELWSSPATELDAVRQVLDDGGDDMEALEALAAEFVTSFRADRAEGCGADYEVVADPPVEVPVAGRPGLRYGFRGLVDDTTVERQIVHGVIHDGTVWLLNAAGYADDGCVPREGEFDVEGVEASADALAKLAAGSRLPDPAR